MIESNMYQVIILEGMVKWELRHVKPNNESSNPVGERPSNRWHLQKLSCGGRVNSWESKGENGMFEDRRRLIPITFIPHIKGMQNGTPLVLEQFKFHELRCWVKDSTMDSCVRSM